MKRCPVCNRTYSEDAQKFCLQDGSPLVADAPQPAQAAPPPLPPTMKLPTPPQPQTSWGPTPPPPAAPKRKIWPWVLGGLGVLFVGGFLLITLLGYVIYKYSDTNNPTGSIRPNTDANANTSDEGPPVDTSNTELFVNSRDTATGRLADNYVDFSFRYPETWQLDPDPSPSFVRVERTNPAGNTIENFSVGWFSVSGGGSGAGNTALLSKTINDLSNSISGSFPSYKKVGEGATTVGRYSGYELRFSGATQGSRGLPYWGRIIILPDPDGGSKGVSLIMLASGHSKEVKSQADLGEKGELPVILKTFRLGVTPGATSSRSATTNTNTSDDEEGQ